MTMRPNDAMVRTGRGTLRLVRRPQATCSSGGRRGPAAHRQPLGPRPNAGDFGIRNSSKAMMKDAVQRQQDGGA